MGHHTVFVCGPICTSMCRKSHVIYENPVSEEQLQRFEPNTVHMCTCQTHITTFNEIQHGGGRHCEEIMFETVEGIKSKFCRKNKMAIVNVLKY